MLWFVVVATAFVVYWPGLKGFFWFDDQHNIVRNENVHLHSLELDELMRAATSSGDSFTRGRPLAMVSFGVNYAISGLDAYWFKLTNLVLHAFAGTLLFFALTNIGQHFLALERRNASVVTARYWALVASALWLIHPLQVSTVLYIVQRMAQISAVFVLLGMLFFVVGRQKLVSGARFGRAFIVGAMLCAPLGMLAKETAVLLPTLLLVLEITLFRLRGLGEADQHFIKATLLITAALPILIGVLIVIYNPNIIMEGYASRSFSLVERLLTETRAIWFYLWLTVVPDLNLLGFYHDDFVVSRDLLAPPSTLLAILALGALVVWAVKSRSSMPVLSFAVLFFLSGHLLESTVFALELVFEHRNYLPSVGPLFAMAYLFFVERGEVGLRALVKVGILAALVLFAGVTALRVQDWTSFGRLVSAEVERSPGSPRANYQYGLLLLSRVVDEDLRPTAVAIAEHHFRRAAVLSPTNIDGLFGVVLSNLMSGQPPDRSAITRLKTRLRTVPLDPTNVTFNLFEVLTRWQLNHSPKLDSGDFVEIFEAALANPAFHAGSKAALLNALRVHSYKVDGDAERATEFGRRAIAMAPNDLDYVEVYVRMLKELGRVEEAERALDDAETRIPLKRAEIQRLAGYIRG